MRLTSTSRVKWGYWWNAEDRKWIHKTFFAPMGERDAMRKLRWSILLCTADKVGMWTFFFFVFFLKSKTPMLQCFRQQCAIVWAACFPFHLQTKQPITDSYMYQWGHLGSISVQISTGAVLHYQGGDRDAPILWPGCRVLLLILTWAVHLMTSCWRPQLAFIKRRRRGLHNFLFALFARDSEIT